MNPTVTDFTLTTPAVLFPAISLLLLAYTNRFLAISNLIRSLKKQYDDDQADHLLHQIRNLRRRILLIRNMQWLGVFSLLLCVVSMFFIFEHRPLTARNIFGAGVVSLMFSLFLSLREIHLSVAALNFEMSDIEEMLREKKNFLRKIEELEI
jgi:Protein of unknown function (DUF2721)